MKTYTFSRTPMDENLHIQPKPMDENLHTIQVVKEQVVQNK